MLPALHINLFSRHIHSFHFFGIIGFISGTLFGCLLAHVLHLEVSIVLLMSAVGAATFFLLAFVAKWIAGKEVIVYYHHEISIMLLCAGTLYFLKKPILNYLDITLLGIGLFLAFGRIGCYSVGCCHGRPYKRGVRYGQAYVDAGFTWYYKNVSLLPVQLIESAYVFFTVIVGSMLLLKYVTPGTVLLCYTVIYGMMRYMLEFFRGDFERPYWYGLSEAQWTTMLLIFISYILAVKGYLPLYFWHTIVVIVLSLISIYIVLWGRKKTSFILFNPRQSLQLIVCLKKLSVDNKPELKVNIYATDSGLNISKGNLIYENSVVTYYTFSGDNKKIFLTKRVIKRLGNLLRIVEDHSSTFKIEKKQSGIFQLIFIKQF